MQLFMTYVFQIFDVVSYLLSVVFVLSVSKTVKIFPTINLGLPPGVKVPS